ncbi:MAG: 4-hydroxybenzoate 3-monooxygenase, partial [Gammaproteobacteria bacterium]|nr:4-hydroxybenzoate 3-monooxygenase [Gammaproteobacteria bacterium]
MTQRTQVAIIGAGPAGLLLGQLLAAEGIDNVILEARDRAYVEARIRAGVIEHGTCEMLRAAGVSERMEREGLRHTGIKLCVDGEIERIDLLAATGRCVRVWGQTEITRDLIRARLAAGLPLLFDAPASSLHDFDAQPVVHAHAAGPSRTALVRYEHAGARHELRCDFVAGCDGFHGIARAHMPTRHLQVFEKRYPFAWLGMLVEAAPVDEELIYARHEDGFALFSMRSNHRSRLYLQVAPDTPLQDWPEQRIFDTLAQRLGHDGPSRLARGEVLDKSITPMRSFVAEPMAWGRLFLAGDAAHIVPPTGAKGLNLAASDVHYLSRALIDCYRHHDPRALGEYSRRALARVWKAQRFSWWMTTMLHRFPEQPPFETRILETELAYTLESEAAKAALAEN